MSFRNGKAPPNISAAKVSSFRYGRAATCGRPTSSPISPVGTYKKAHRHGADFHVFAVTGHGFSLLWYEGEKDFVRIDWKHGWVFAPPDQMFHQHFNTAGDPARYLAVAFGSLRYPFTTDKRNVFLGMDVSVKDGGCQIEYEHQDPRIHKIYLEELGKYGVTSGMAKFIDEPPYAKSPT
jgi:hypothetical protein